MPGDVVDHKGRERWRERTLEEGLPRRESPARDGADPRRTGYDVSAMIEQTSPTVIGTIIVSFFLASQAQLLDVLLGDAQLHGLIPARRLGCLGHLANALGPWPSRRS